MAASQYECVDATSSDLSDWKISYIHHTEMVALLYECVDVPSKYLTDWKISYICYM